MTGDGMAMRMMLLRNVMGTATYQYHTEQTIKTLRAIAQGKTPFQIAELEKLKAFAKRLGITIGEDWKKGVKKLCDFVEKEFNKKYDEPSTLVEILGPEERKATIDAIFALAYGLYTYVNPIPTVTGGPNLVKLLTEDLKDITGGLLSVEPDAVKAVDGVEKHFLTKRKKLGL